MTWALHRLALAISAMVSLVFVVPLVVLTWQAAHERAVSDARWQATAMVAALAVDGDPRLLARAMDSTAAGRDRRMALHLPGAVPLGVVRVGPDDVATAVRSGRPATVESTGGLCVLQPVTLDGGGAAVIEVFVPDADLRRGALRRSLEWGGLALLLIAGSVLLADRLGGRLVKAVRRLAGTAERLGAGDLEARVRPSGPRELHDAAVAFNAMADDLRRLLNAERELAADLSHRLRTPLTALRLDAEAIPDGPLADRMRQACDLLEEELEAIITSARSGVESRGTQSCDLAEVMADRLAFWSVLAEDQNRPWAVDGGDHPLPVPVAESDLIGVIDALIGNVFAHTAEGTAFRVTVSASGLVVDDAGPGIADPASAVRRGVSGAGSTGLGLDIVRRVAADAGGRLEIGRGALGGTRIALLLPGPGGLLMSATDPGRRLARGRRPGRPAS